MSIKFKKIIKWAIENNYEVKNGYNEETIIVEINNNLYFEIENISSTVSYGRKGMIGKRAGIYMSVNIKNRSNGSCSYRSQKDVILEIEENLK